MLGNKIVLVLVTTILVGIVAYRYKNLYAYMTGQVTREPFWMTPSRQYRVERVMAPNKEAAERGEFTVVPANYQAAAPRFSNMDAKANIRGAAHAASASSPYKPYAPDAQGAKSADRGGPVSFQDMASDTMEADAGKTTDASGGSQKPDKDPASGYREEYPDAAEMIPVNDMTHQVNDLGEDSQPVVYDQLIYANRNSRLRSRGDPFRGDLPIVPHGGDWFRPSAHPNVDLQQGAMNVLAGENNETTKALTNLIQASSRGCQETVAGSHVQMGNQYETSLSAANGDINVSSYP